MTQNYKTISIKKSSWVKLHELKILSEKYKENRLKDILEKIIEEEHQTLLGDKNV